MDEFNPGVCLLLFVPIVICIFAGAIHGSRPRARLPGIVIVAFLLSGLLCWSIGVGGGHPPGAVVAPAWIVSPLSLLSGAENGDAFPSPWLHPWLAFAAYIAAARFARPTPMPVRDGEAAAPSQAEAAVEATETPAAAIPEGDDAR